MNVPDWLAPDDPAAVVEVDVAAEHVDVRVDGGDRSLELADDELAALRRGLTLLDEDGARALLDRLPAARPATPAEGGGGDRLVLQVSPSLAGWLARHLDAGLWERQRDGSALLPLDVTDVAALLPWLLRLGPRVDILSPRLVRARLAEGAAGLAEQARRPPG